MTRIAILAVSLEGGSTEEVALDRDPFIVGGGDRADARLPGIKAAAALRFVRRQETWRVELIDGKCGAQLNGQAFIGGAVADGDVVTLGDVRLTLRHREVEAAGEAKLKPLGTQVVPPGDPLDWQHAAYARLVTAAGLKDTADGFVTACAVAVAPVPTKLALLERAYAGWKTLAATPGMTPPVLAAELVHDLTRAGRPLVAGGRGLVPLICDERLVAVLAFECAEDRWLEHSVIWALQRFARLGAPLFQARTLRLEIDEWMRGCVDLVVATAEAKDAQTQGHAERVSRYCAAIAEDLALSEARRRALIVSALCHDVGKIGVAEAILQKPGRLSPEEFEEIKSHPTIGAEIIGKLPHAAEILGGVRHHHERWDGSGYPDGLAGEQIPLFGRIIAVADAYDAMVSGHASSPPMTPAQAAARLSELAATFDPRVLRAFLSALDRGMLAS